MVRLADRKLVAGVLHQQRVVDQFVGRDGPKVVAGGEDVEHLGVLAALVVFVGGGGIGVPLPDVGIELLRAVEPAAHVVVAIALEGQLDGALLLDDLAHAFLRTIEVGVLGVGPGLFDRGYAGAGADGVEHVQDVLLGADAAGLVEALGIAEQHLVVADDGPGVALDVAGGALRAGMDELAEEDGRLLVLEEFIPGDTLQDLADCSLFPEKKAREITLQICQALYVMHGLGLVHRDVKPSNVVIHGDRAVLIDFSASRFMKAFPDEPSGQGHDTVILGSPGYAAPEQHGLSRTDGRADLYSLGVMLNVMVTGDHPSRKLAGGRLGRVISRCTMTNPKKRYRDVVHLMEAL